MKKVLALGGIFVFVVATFVVLLANDKLQESVEKDPGAYVGVTYCGSSVAEGKALVDKVKNYTNLFVLQSGTLQRDFRSVDELGDYAISNGLKFLPYFGMILPQFPSWLTNATQKWGDSLIGVYYGDEPGGKMLDDYTTFSDEETGETVTKTTYGDILVQKSNGTSVVYEIGGNIRLLEPATGTQTENVYVTFYPNGTITATKSNSTTLTNEPIQNYTATTTYLDLINCKPLKDVDDIAHRFTSNDRANIQMIKKSARLFTSDYSLYWFDYLSGYDVVLSQIGWNNSLTQQIALERGAAKLQNKEWGIIITWKYDHAPYLADGEEIFNQMRTAYSNGAKYLVLFNYYENQANPDGAMQEEHFKALQDFWNLVIKNPNENQRQSADSALILPRNYACAFRWKEDKIWGVIQPNQTSIEIFNLITNTIDGDTLDYDVIFDDPNFPVSSDYQQILYWNRTR